MIIEIITSRNTHLKETGFGLVACTDIKASLERMGYTASVTVCETQEDLQSVVTRKPDMVVLATKYMPVKDCDDVWFSEFFASHNIIFSGSNRETLKYDSNKISAKKRLTTLGIKTAKFFTAVPEEYKNEKDLPLSFPLFLKPMDAANGNGVDDLSFVTTFSEFTNKVLSLSEIYQQPVLVEEYLGGKEFTVAIIKSNSGALIVSAIEIVPLESSGGLKILGELAKLSDNETLHEVNSGDIESVKEIATAAFKGLGVSGFGRIDIKMDNIGNCYFIEANLVPGMNSSSNYFSRACKMDNDMSYDTVIKSIFDDCLTKVNISKAVTV